MLNVGQLWHCLCACVDSLTKQQCVRAGSVLRYAYNNTVRYAGSQKNAHAHKRTQDTSERNRRNTRKIITSPASVVHFVTHPWTGARPALLQHAHTCTLRRAQTMENAQTENVPYKQRAFLRKEYVHACERGERSSTPHTTVTTH